MSVKAMWGLAEWESSLVNNKQIPDVHPLKAKDKFGLKDKKPFSTHADAKEILTACTEYDTAVEKFAKNTDLKTREAAMGEMKAARDKFSSHFIKLNDFMIKKVNPSGSAFSAELSTQWKTILGREKKIVDEMHSKIGAAEKAVDVLKKGAPERPKTAAPGAAPAGH